MIKLKVIAMSASKKSALCVAQLTSGKFISELGVGNIRVTEELEVGSIHDTPFTKCNVVQTSAEDGTIFSWLSLGL